MKHLLFAIAAALLGSAPAFSGTTPTRAGNSLEAALDTVQPSKIHDDLFFIASDDLAGRDTPSPGQRVAARFIRSRMERLGWKPGYKDGYLYPWSWDLRVLDPEASFVEVEIGGAKQKLAFGKEYYFYSRSLQDSDVTGAVVFCGQGAKQDFAGLKLANTWALCWDTDAVTWRDREANATEAGALGLLLVPGSDYAGKDYAERFKGDVSRAQRGSRGSSEKKAPFLPTIYLAPAATAAWGSAQWKLGEALPMRVHEIRKVPGTIELENVCAFWPGSDPELAKEVIIVSAHYDHVGVGSDGQIYNGADDNGSGTCGLMALAEAIAKFGPMKRSILLMWVSGEEKGLLGSDAWTKNPWLPEGCRPLCDINIDMIGRNAPDKLLITPTKARKEYNGLVKLAEKFAPLEGFPQLGSCDDYWDRSDHRNFAVNLKIPVTFLFSDVHEDYHKPTDDPDKIDFDKIRRVVRLVLRMIDAMQERELNLG